MALAPPTPLDSLPGRGRFTQRPAETRLVFERRIWLAIVLAEVAVAALFAWIAIVRRADPRAIDDTGLISVIPISAYTCIAVLAVTFVVALRMRPLVTPLLLLQTGALIAMLYGAPAFFEEMPRFITAWLHVGFSDAIARTAELYPLRDARFDWPGFFILAAFFSSVTEIDSLISVLPWIPPAQVLLYLGPLYLIIRSATSDGRVVWLSLWFFCLMNWVGQDYFSPQGLNVLLYLSVLAVLLTWFRAPSGAWYQALARRLLRKRRPSGDDDGDRIGSTPSANIEEPLSSRQHVGLIAVIALLFGASVASHQLTPFALLGGVILLVVLGRIRLTGLPLLMFILLVSWLMFRASTFLAGHLAGLLEDIGRPDQFAASNVAARLAGSPGHFFVVQARLVFTLGIWLLALAGGLRLLRSRRVNLSMAALAVAPFGLILLQGYGGEMLLRIFLFSVPFMAFHAAMVFLPSLRSQSWLGAGAIVLTTMVLATGFLLTRYGNEKSDLVTAEDYEAVRYVLSVAQPGDTLASANASVPIGHGEWEQHAQFNVGALFLEGDIDALIEELERRRRPGSDTYFVLTRGQRSAAELFWAMSDAEWEERVQALGEELEMLYENRDATVYRLPTPEPGESG